MNSHDDSGLESIPKGNDFFIQLMGLMVHSGRINILILQIQRWKGPYRTETGHFDQAHLGPHYCIDGKQSWLDYLLFEKALGTSQNSS